MSSEQPLKIPLSDGKFAIAKLRGPWTQPLIIFAHGFSGTMDRIIPYESSKFFSHHGFSFLRFNFYANGDDTRKLIDTTLAIQSSDLGDIIAYARSQGARHIHVMGHSYGGLAILQSPELNVDSAILVDPSHPTVNFFKRAAFIETLDAYRFQSKGLDYLIGRSTVAEFESLEVSSYLRHFRTPSLIVSAAAGPLKATNQQYAKSLQSQTQAELVEIPNADHPFDTDDALDRLLAASLTWLQNRHEVKI